MKECNDPGESTLLPNGVAPRTILSMAHGLHIVINVQCLVFAAFFSEYPTFCLLVFWFTSVGKGFPSRKQRKCSGGFACSAFMAFYYIKRAIM